MGIAWHRSGKDHEQAEEYFNEAIKKLDSEQIYKLAVEIFPDITAVWNALGSLHLLRRPQPDYEKRSTRTGDRSAWTPITQAPGMAYFDANTA